MTKIRLTVEQKLALELQHKNSRDCHVRDKIRCVLLSAEGSTTCMIAQSQFIHETTVLHHLKDYQQFNKLKPANGGLKCSGSQNQDTRIASFH